MMNFKMHRLLLFLPVCLPVSLFAQPEVLTEAWRDPAFVERFTHSFLPLTQQEPQITEEEKELFNQLATLMDNDQTEQALQLLRNDIQSRPAPEVSAALNYTLANLLLQSGDNAGAVRQYNTAIQKFDSFRRAFKNRGLAYIQNQQFEEAVASLVEAIELGDTAGDTFGLLAFSYLNTGDAVAALEGYRQASLLNPGNREWRIGKAEALMRTERYEEAIAQFKELIEELPERDVFYTSIANAYLSLGQSNTAARYLEVLRRRGTAKANPLALLGDIYINEGLPGLGLTAYLDALETGNLSAQRLFRALRAMLMRGSYEEAETFHAALQEQMGEDLSQDQERELLNIEAQLSLAQGDDEKAAAILEEVLKVDPLNGNALILLGEYYQNQGDFETALHYFERAVALPDFQREAQLQMARIYVRQREYRKAIRELEEAQQLEYSSNVQDFLDAVRSAYNRAL